MTDEIQEALEKIFAADSEIYQGRGFQRRIGYGTRPALVNIDLANAWTRPGNTFSCEHMDVIIPATQKLLAAARAKRIPIVFTSTAYNVTDGHNTDMGLWHHKIPAEQLQVGTWETEIDDRIAPQPGEHVIVKKTRQCIPRNLSFQLLEGSRRRHRYSHRRYDGRVRSPFDRRRHR